MESTVAAIGAAMGTSLSPLVHAFDSFVHDLYFNFGADHEVICGSDLCCRFEQSLVTVDLHGLQFTRRLLHNF